MFLGPASKEIPTYLPVTSSSGWVFVLPLSEETS